jgi:nicotinamidase-related amidase
LSKSKYKEVSVLKNLLAVIDMQNDFIDGSLGTDEAKEIVKRVCDKINDFEGDIVFTRDTHFENYLETQEGRKLPVKHCIKGSHGWQIKENVYAAAKGREKAVIDKPTFGSVELAQLAKNENYDKITLIGLCTDICVISNAMLLKAYMPEKSIEVIASLCAGVTPQSHENALNAMKMCQIEVL